MNSICAAIGALALMLGGIIAPAAAQPVEWVDAERVLVTVPVRVQVGPDGKVTIPTRVVGPILETDLGSHMPPWVPVVSVDEDGWEREGLFFEYERREPFTPLAVSIPGAVIYNKAEGYHVEWQASIQGGRTGELAMHGRVAATVVYRARTYPPVAFRLPSFESIASALGIPLSVSFGIERVLLSLGTRLQLMLPTVASCDLLRVASRLLNTVDRTPGVLFSLIGLSTPQTSTPESQTGPAACSPRRR